MVKVKQHDVFCLYNNETPDLLFASLFSSGTVHIINVEESTLQNKKNGKVKKKQKTPKH